MGSKLPLLNSEETCRIDLLFNGSMNQGEYEALMSDTTKRIDRHIDWTEDEDHSPAVSFLVEVLSDPAYPLYAKGYLNRAARKLTYVLIHRAEGRIYGLDLGKDHRNPDGTLIGEKHKHRWSEQTGVKVAYFPEDIAATVDRPVEVWEQFCAEANLVHDGRMNPPPPEQLDMML